MRRRFFGPALESILSSEKGRIFRKRGHFNKNRKQFLKIENKLKLSEDRGQIKKIEDSSLKNQADGQPKVPYFQKNCKYVCGSSIGKIIIVY